jgi:hypothetical protein
MKLLASAGILAAAVIASATVPLSSTTTRDPDNLVVHEWGTFTSIAGEDDAAVDWLPLDGSQDLPCFVERFNGFNGLKGRLTGTVRMETPVLYFYADRPTTVDVSVRFRQGQITEWFPSAEGLQRAMPINPSSPAYESTATWRKLAITPNGPEQFPTESGSSHYYAARATDAAPVTVNGQREKFLFYRGVGRFGLPLSATIESDGQIRLRTLAGHDRVGTVVTFENQSGKLAYEIHRITGNETLLRRPAPAASFGALATQLEDILVREGLYAKEARAMIETWRDSWFEEGLRLLYVVPRRTVDDVLALQITPRPTHVARAFVGRMELLTPAMLVQVRQAIETKDTPTLLKYGRFLQPALDRLYGINTPARVSPQVSRALDPVYQARARTAPACATAR